MKKGVLNYSITWNQDGEKHEEIYFTKMDTVRRYLNIMVYDLDQRLDGNSTCINSLRVWEIYTAPTKQPEDITGRINKFLA